ncbi:Putative short-chain dehydrogenase/reductase SDR, NAD(P)-binding domain superfamily [Septoria linicola]|uniref:Short-chain dehydrogenase/reductase SDR, NAD(P)-binding domain superfamily n=1 Tax=Septoria linicola TaxID=215465 RepID=A0A9Q9EJZ2_9PEZI|nr:Putative short-chain dehydrogenase/reductase SDR, NAD(P)-binding domain superfamily [Septoria linicola]
MPPLTGNKFDPNSAVPDLSGRVYVVTGGSAGIGFGICAHILQHNPAALYILSKKGEHLEEAQEGLKKYGDVGKVHTIQCDLEDLQQTDEVAGRLSKELLRLDALVLNAGLGVGPYAESKDGIDTHMQVNVFAQHHLAMMLLPLLVQTHDSRLVLQSSDLHRGASSDIEFKDIAEINQDIGPARLYNRSKLAQVLMVRALVRRKQQGKLGMKAGSAPWINATHPGAVTTDQQEQAVEAYGTLGKIGVAATRPFMKEPIDEGCRPALFAATSPDIVKQRIDGSYIVPNRKVSSTSAQAESDELSEALWNLTADVLQRKLGKLPYSLR